MLDWTVHTLILPSGNPNASLYGTVLGTNEKLVGEGSKESKVGLVIICRALYKKSTLFIVG